MVSIVRGTTPTIQFVFKKFDVADITAAILTVQECGTTVIERDLTSATVGEDHISWTLTQTETLQLTGKVEAECNWLLADGTRGKSQRGTYTIDRNSKEEVMP